MSHEITLKQAMNQAFQAECILCVLSNHSNEMSQVIRDGLIDAALYLCGNASTWLSEEEATREK